VLNEATSDTDQPACELGHLGLEGLRPRITP